MPTHIEHHHLLVRMEIRHCPKEHDVDVVKGKFETIIRDIHMKALAPPTIRYLKGPPENKGMTGIMPIETSHIAFHFWDTPERGILQNSKSSCLLQFDLYTCGSLSHAQIAKVLGHMSCYRPVAAEITLLNRQTGLAIEKHVRWSEQTHGAWAPWLRRWRSAGGTRRR